MRVKSLVEFASVPKGSVGTVVKDGKLWKITWDNVKKFRGSPFKKRKLEDWFDEYEFKTYLEVIAVKNPDLEID